MVDDPSVKDLPEQLLVWSCCEKASIRRDMIKFVHLIEINKNGPTRQLRQNKFLKKHQKLRLVLYRFATWNRIRCLQMKQIQLVPVMYWMTEWFEISCLKILNDLEKLMRLWINNYDNSELFIKLNAFLLSHPTLTTEIQNFLCFQSILQRKDPGGTGPWTIPIPITDMQALEIHDIEWARQESCVQRTNSLPDIKEICEASTSSHVRQTKSLPILTKATVDQGPKGILKKHKNVIISDRTVRKKLVFSEDMPKKDPPRKGFLSKLKSY
ncbi:unnamed protein product [Chironomus riparius]|uniref:Uncharacterized protein n=1 Tax=Chironomus riparius TaxID=315576 RepID=A0A9N9WTV5_9DIPT|nr:unnamed protein product [Chironomus riparius]